MNIESNQNIVADGSQKLKNAISFKILEEVKVKNSKELKEANIFTLWLVKRKIRKEALRLSNKIRSAPPSDKTLYLK